MKDTCKVKYYIV